MIAWSTTSDTFGSQVSPVVQGFPMASEMKMFTVTTNGPMARKR